MSSDWQVNPPLPSIDQEYERITEIFTDTFEDKFEHPMQHYAILIRGEPGCGKSFIIVFWAKKYAEAGFKVMVMVPFRRLALQMMNLFLSLARNQSEVDSLMVIQGKSPSLFGIENKLIIICTYEHAYQIKTKIGSCDAVVIDEVHNLYYPERGWQLDPFLSTRRLLLCTGTMTVDEKRELAHMLTRNPKRKVSAVDLRTDVARFSRTVGIEKFANDKDSIMAEGGVFYFFPQKSSAIKAAYAYAKEMRMALINPLLDHEVSLFPSCAELQASASQECIDIDEIPDEAFRKKPTVYIDFSTHFSSRIRELLSKDPRCKINVFCTTTLCEGLNLRSLKAVVIAGGLWDWRRVKQIEGRAGRFLQQITIYKGPIHNKEKAQLVLDLFDRISLDVRGQLGELRCYEVVPNDELGVEDQDYKNLVDFLKTSDCYGVQGWLKKNFCINPSIKYSTIKKLQDRTSEFPQGQRNSIIQAALLENLDKAAYFNYQEFFLPVLKVDYMDLSCLPEEDEE